MKFIEIFLDRDKKLRSGWRVVGFAFLFLVLLTVIQLFAAVSFGMGHSPLANISVGTGTVLAASLLAGWLCGRAFEKLPFAALGAAFTRSWLTHFLIGAAAGVITLAFAVLIAVVLGGLRFSPSYLSNPSATAISSIVSLAVLAIAAASEEALFRGYILQTFARSGFAWLAIGVTAIGFGMAHYFNPGADLISTANTILAGVWFGVAYLRTRDLWFVWGMHLMWNWMQGAFFGIEISGVTTFASAPIFHEIDSGPTWLTGSAYGIEGGIAATIAIAASTILIYFLPTRPRHSSNSTNSTTQ